jgi:glutathionyl-hydroquinone reductase
MAATSQFPDETTEEGEFARQEDAFRDWVSADGSTAYTPEAGRYHLYVSLACPWAHRSLIARNLKGLQSAIDVTVVDPVRDERGWAFHEGAGHGPDPVNGFKFLSEAYHASNRDYRGRVTVPVLWDTKTRRIVNNSEDDLCRMFDGVFSSFGRSNTVLFPAAIETAHAKLAQEIYERVNNGVYRAGFATRQSVYERACRNLFEALDEHESRLASTRFLFGDKPVEADWRMFCTLVRFDAVYHGHFKCNVRRIVDYPNLQGYLCDLYQQPGISETVNLDHIKRHYYITHEEINPTRIVPLGPELDFMRAHSRAKLSSTNTPK